MNPMPGTAPISDRDYTRILTLRTRLRRFEHWSAQRAAEHGLTSAQHQLLLAIRGHGGEQAPTIGQIAEYLMIGHNAAVGLADRAENLGLLRRARDDEDRRVVRLSLTAQGEEKLESLAAVHLQELTSIGPLIDALSTDLTEH